MIITVRLLQAACLFAVLASAAGGAWYLYATVVRPDWTGVAIGVAAAARATAWGTGVMLRGEQAHNSGGQRKPRDR